jgi:hypothetical protein
MIGTTENVPVQDGPLHPPAATLSRESGEVDQKGSTDQRSLRPRGDADERLGDLDGVRRRALEEVVGDAPILDHPSLHTHPPDVSPVFSGDLDGRWKVVGDLDAGRLPQRFEDRGEICLPLGLHVEMLSAWPVWTGILTAVAKTENSV